MKHATGEYSAITLSSHAVRPTKSDAGKFKAGRQLLSDEPKPLAFDLSLGDDKRLRVTLTGSKTEPAWLWRVLDILQRLSVELAPNWDSYGAQPLSLTAISRCLEEVVSPLLEAPLEPTIVPTQDGGVQLEWHARGVDLEVKVPPAGPISYLFADTNTGEVREWEDLFDRPVVYDALARMA